jgi:hypothetical protein
MMMNSSNIMFKGFFPYIIDLNIYTEETINEEKNNSLLKDLKLFFKQKAYDLNIQITDINKIIKKYYSDGVCSTSINGKLFLSTNLYEELSISFPISIKDINISTNFAINEITENTIAVFLNNVKVTNAN